VPALDAALSAVDVTVADEWRRLLPAEIDDQVSLVAGRLAARGVGVGSVVSWQSPNRVEAWLLYRACWRLGAIAAPVHHAAGEADVVACLRQVTPDLVIADRALPAASRPDAIDTDSFSAGPVGAAAESRSVDPAALAVVLFTSGSSGRPKAVLHTHRGLLYKARTMTAVHGLGPDDAVLMPAPLAHISGLLNGVLVPGVAGMKTVLMARWDPSVAVSTIEQEAITFMIGPPTFFVGLMDAPGFSPERVAALRLVSSGGAGVTPAFVADASKRLACRVKRAYGSTEAPTVTTSGSADPEDRARDTDGRATGVAEIQIVAPSGEVVAAGVPGEVWVRGPEVCVGYADPAMTQAAFTTDGWFRTGDLGVLDGAGWLTITGRMNDVIIRGGENITATEVEGVLESHPDIRQAVVVGYPDDRLGQRVCAFVVAPAGFGLAQCRVWMEQRGVTRFKWPERVEAVDSLPLLAAGKVDRSALERRAAGSPPG
jgi:cyclohexanecarboxylate-CoA ligase